MSNIFTLKADVLKKFCIKNYIIVNLSTVKWNYFS